MNKNWILLVCMVEKNMVSTKQRLIYNKLRNLNNWCQSKMKAVKNPYRVKLEKYKTKLKILIMIKTGEENCRKNWGCWQKNSKLKILDKHYPDQAVNYNHPSMIVLKKHRFVLQLII